MPRRWPNENRDVPTFIQLKLKTLPPGPLIPTLSTIPAVKLTRPSPSIPSIKGNDCDVWRPYLTITTLPL